MVCQLEEMGSSHVRFLISVVHLAFAIVARTHLNLSVWKVLNQPLLQTRMWVPGSGCTRTALTCDKNATLHGGNDLFLNVSCIKLPSNSKSILAQNGDECKRICMDNCSCTAYSNGSNCSTWHGDLLNLQQSTHSDPSCTFGDEKRCT